MASSVLYVFYLTRSCLHVKAPWILFCWLSESDKHTQSWLCFVFSFFLVFFSCSVVTQTESWPGLLSATYKTQVAALCLERPGQPCVSVLFKRLWKPQRGILLCCWDVIFPLLLWLQPVFKQKQNVFVLICLECDKSLIVTVTRI